MKRRIRRWSLLLFVACLATLGCDPDSLSDTLRDSFNQGMLLTGFWDPEPEPPELVDILCDSSDGASCNEETLRKTLQSVFSHRKQSPGSRIRLWKMGVRLSDTVMVFEVQTPLPQKKKKGKADHTADRWMDKAEEDFVTSMQKIWRQDPPRRTPLAESLTKIGIAESYDLPRSIIVITDAREYRLGNFECRPPGTEYWKQLLKQNGALLPASLNNVRIYFTFVTMPEVRGCAVSLARESKIRSLWTSTMQEAGAKFSITSDLVQFDSPAKEQ
jgi:hypothetical protein